MIKQSRVNGDDSTTASEGSATECTLDTVSETKTCNVHDDRTVGFKEGCALKVNPTFALYLAVRH
jgi:hypothetical protein